MVNMRNAGRTIALVALFCAIIGAIYLLVQQNVKGFEKTVINQTQNYLLTIAKTQAQHIEGLFINIHAGLGILASNPTVQKRIRENLGAAEISEKAYHPAKIVFEHMANMVDSLYTIDSKGIVQTRLPFEGEVRGKDFSKKPGVNFILENYDIRSGHTRSHKHISKIFTTDSGRKAISVSVPVLENEEFVGILRAIVHLDIVEDIISYVKAGKHGYAWMIDGTGLIVAHPKAEHGYIGADIIAKKKEAFPSYNWFDLKDIVARMKTGQEGAGFYHLAWWEDGKLELTKELTAFAPVRMANESWSIGVSMRYDEVSGPVKAHSKKLSMIGGILIVLLIAIATVFLKLQKNRIQLAIMAQSADELNSINRRLEREISERKRAEKEIEKHRDHLEELVADRTEELTKANKDLKREIAERRKAERALKEAKDEAEAANRAKSQFLANMSHEIRTPLNGIVGFSELVIRSDSLERCHEHGRIILEESEHLLGLINEILDHAKIEAGKLKLEYRPIDFKTLLETVVSSVHVQAKKKGLQLTTFMDDSVYRYVMGDSLRLRQILLNLASNAIKFTDKGSVAVKVEPVETEGNVSTIRFSVIDTGIGIPLDKQPSVFDSFVQADESTTRKYGGTGLGITIAKQLVTLMGGQMGLESQPGKGSTFWFTLPLEMSESAPEPDDGTVSDESKGLYAKQDWERSGHILVAEDYPVNQRVARQHLEEAGYTVTIVEDGEKAVSACGAHKYDLILMDVQMPNMDGYDATRHIRSRSSLCAKVPILALTANADLETRNACKKANMDDVLTKPIRRNSLLSAVDRWIALTGQPPDRSGNSFLDENDDTSPKEVMPIDYDVALEEFGDMNIVNEVVAHFIEKVQTQIQDMREALTEQDIDGLRRDAHAIKGGAGTLEAKPLAREAEQMESLCKSNDLKAIPSALDNVVTEFDRLRTYVESCSQS